MVFAYLVIITLRREEDVAVFVEHFEPLRQFCNTPGNEPNTLTYELLRDEKCPKRMLIIERYVGVADLEETHRSSAPFKTFCEVLTALNIIETKENHRYFTELLPSPPALTTTSNSSSEREDGVLVFCGSRMGQKPSYAVEAESLGSNIARSGRALVYGGGTVGIMGALARSVQQHGGAIISVIPRALMPKEVSGESLGRLIVTETMADRKTAMFRVANIVIALPGGIGTYDELMEVLTLYQLGAYRPRIGLVNIDGYFDPLLATLRHTIAEGFLDEAAMRYILVRNTASELFEALTDDNSYVAEPSAIMLDWGSNKRE